MAMMNLLQITQEFCRRRSLPQPVTVVGATDDTTLQIWGLLNEGMQDICQRFEWPWLNHHYTFTHEGGGASDPRAPYRALSYGNVASGTQAAMENPLNCTLWDVTSKRLVFGPMNPKDVQFLLTMDVAQAVYSWWVEGDGLSIYPFPNPLSSIQFQLIFKTGSGILSLVSPFGPTESFGNDTDTPMCPPVLLLADLRWRYNYIKGMPYAEEKRQFEEMLTNLVGRIPAPTVSLDNINAFRMAGPGLLIAAGNWPL